MTKLKWPTFWNDGSISKGLTPPVLSNEKKRQNVVSILAAESSNHLIYGYCYHAFTGLLICN